jgi:thiol:disulfide interchange protein DsbD
MTVDVPVDSVLTSATESSSGGPALSLPWALLFAFGGGLLLNLMPCVFPVLSVKILGFAQQGDDEPSRIRTHGLLFGAGVLVSMWILAGALLGLRAAGSQIGWGFQLQSPTFIALMALLFVGIGLNLLGAFEVGTRVMNWGGRMQSAAPDAGGTSAFLTGVLATVVATPCTAPFMGAALGVALTLSVGGALLIFTALGAGMAAPYVGLSMSPALLQKLPKPGRWMETLKQLFAFPMFATAIWLVWVFGQQTGNGGVALLLFGMLLLGLAAWIVHRWSLPQLSRMASIAARTAVVAMVGGAVAAGLVGARSSAPPSPAASANVAGSGADTASASWTPYSAETVASLREDGRPVFVDFTAAWCLTCQVNERSVLNTETVQDAFAKRNVALVKADWTNRDAEITKALASHGRSGVPVYVLYPGDGSEPTLLPEVLTQDIVLDALRNLPPSDASSQQRASVQDAAPAAPSS